MDKYNNNALEESLNKFLPYLVQPNFRGAIVCRNSRHFYGHSGLFSSVIKVLKQSGKDVVICSWDMRLKFSSGATITFNRLDSLDGLLLDAALIIDDLSTTREDILKVKSRLWNHKGVGDNLWLLNINDV